MIKEIKLNGKDYEIEIKWGGNCYCFRVVGVTGFNAIPNEYLKDIEKIKPLIIEAINKDHDLKAIELWDGNL